MCSVDVEQLLRPGATPTAPLRPRHLGASLGHASCHNQVPHSRGYNRHASFIALPPLLHSLSVTVHLWRLEEWRPRKRHTS